MSRKGKFRGSGLRSSFFVGGIIIAVLLSTSLFWSSVADAQSKATPAKTLKIGYLLCLSG
jgi:hypothetical protein